MSHLLSTSQLPDGVSVAKDAKLAFAKAATVFVQFLTATANDFAKSCNRTTVAANHILGAIDEIDFKEFKEPLEQALEEFKEQQKTKKATKEKKAGENTTAAAGQDDVEESGGNEGDDMETSNAKTDNV